MSQHKFTWIIVIKIFCYQSITTANSWPPTWISQLFNPVYFTLGPHHFDSKAVFDITPITITMVHDTVTTMDKALTLYIRPTTG